MPCSSNVLAVMDADTISGGENGMKSAEVFQSELDADKILTEQRMSRQSISSKVSHSPTVSKSIEESISSLYSPPS